MSRFSRYEDDSARLPSGMTRIGYDADTQTYTYRDADGSRWEGNPGNRYGRLHPVSGRPAAPNAQNPSDASMPFLEGGEEGGYIDDDGSKISWRRRYMPLLNFFFLVCIVVVCLVVFLRKRPSFECQEGWKARTVYKGDTCFDIAQGSGITVDDLLKGNAKLDCERLKLGMQLCVPEI